MIVTFSHGLVFFLMGFAVLLQSRQRRHVSEVTVAQSLPWLGLFGIVQALAIWGATFVPLQSSYVPESTVRTLLTLETLLMAIAATLLLHFGARLWADSLDRKTLGRRTLHLLAPVLFGSWLLLFSVLGIGGSWEHIEHWLGSGQVMASYGLVLPGAIITCWALLLQAHEFRTLGMNRLIVHLKWLTFSVALFSVTAFINVTPTPHFPGHILNRENFLEWTGVPVDVPAGTAGLLMAIFGVRILELFNIELGRRLDAARRVKILLDERDRIARELHDGIIQQLYGVGLTLESAVFALDKTPDKVREILQGAMNRLDETIQDMRVYIMDLKGADEHTDLIELLRALVDEMAEEHGISIELDAGALNAGYLSDEERGHILQIVREAVSNAVRHGRAHRVIVSIRQQHGLHLIIEDDGTGFEFHPSMVSGGPKIGQRVHHGLRNMMRRAELLEGYLDVQSEIGKGTRVLLTLPERTITQSGKNSSTDRR